MHSSSQPINNMLFKNRQLIFSDVPYDDIVFYLNSINTLIPIDITETYVLALTKINKRLNVDSLPNSIKNWIYAYELQEKEFIDSN